MEMDNHINNEYYRKEFESNTSNSTKGGQNPIGTHEIEATTAQELLTTPSQAPTQNMDVTPNENQDTARNEEPNIDIQLADELPEDFLGKILNILDIEGIA